MERPTCKTCPHWDDIDAELDEAPDVHEGVCRRFPPVLLTSDEVGKGDCSHLDPTNWAQPATCENWSCGEHPGFAAVLRHAELVRQGILRPD